MRIPEEILGAAEKQLDADCGIGKEGKDGMIVTAQNKTVFRRAPYFPPKAYMTDAAYGELVRETLEKETGIRPRIYEGIDPFFRGIVFMGKAKILAGEEIFDRCKRTGQPEKSGMALPVFQPRPSACDAPAVWTENRGCTSEFSSL